MNSATAVHRSSRRSSRAPRALLDSTCHKRLDRRYILGLVLATASCFIDSPDPSLGGTGTQASDSATSVGSARTTSTTTTTTTVPGEESGTAAGSDSTESDGAESETGEALPGTQGLSTFLSADTHRVWGVAQSSSGQLALAGVVEIPDGPNINRDGFVLGVGEDGSEVFSFRVGGDLNDQLLGVVALDEGMMAAVGITRTFNNGESVNNDSMLIVFAEDGTVIEGTHLGSPTDETPRWALADGDHIIFGGAGGGSDSSDDGLVVKYTPGTGVAWARDVGTAGDEFFRAGVLDSDGGYILAGQRSTGSTRDPWIAKLSSDGDLLWSKTIVGTGDDWFTDVVVVGGVIYAVGTTQAFGPGGFDGWVVRIDPRSTTAETATFGAAAFDSATGAAASQGGSLVVFGSRAADGTAAFSAALDTRDLSFDWSASLGVLTDVRLTAGKPVPRADGGWALGGERLTAKSPDHRDIFVAFTNAQGRMPDGCSDAYDVPGTTVEALPLVDHEDTTSVARAGVVSDVIPLDSPTFRDDDLVLDQTCEITP